MLQQVSGTAGKVGGEPHERAKRPRLSGSMNVEQFLTDIVANALLEARGNGQRECGAITVAETRQRRAGNKIKSQVGTVVRVQQSANVHETAGGGAEWHRRS